MEYECCAFFIKPSHTSTIHTKNIFTSKMPFEREKFHKYKTEDHSGLHSPKLYTLYHWLIDSYLWFRESYNIYLS